MIYIKVVVITSAKKESIIEKKSNYFQISVKEKAERNMANDRVLQMIANYFKLSINNVRIINGHHHPHKLLVIEDGK